ncbi:MAG: diadenylate cyclase CdaA [Elusimicrobia bacterium]|nr:diadenylate cyclase CdaA [Candidatus Obscuribacterium magneticum]
MSQLGLFWNQFLVHVVDIFLVSFIFYQLLLLIQGTRAVQIVVGIVIVAVVTLLSNLLGLPVLGWLLQKFWIAGVVVFAVLFQPEMRSALARLGSRTSGRMTIHEEIMVINEIIAAVKEASRRQMGMLVVLERDVGLRNYIETGTAVNGEVTSELLLTLFQPPSILHDGAVVIRGGRVAAAGCILPLSQNASLEKWLGTRHRAAVGITEISDACAVCVSEETGNISLCQGGQIEVRMDPDELRQKLLTLYRSSGPVTTVPEAGA